jgi:hypothetical protein
MNSSEIAEYIHESLDKEVNAIGGRYVFTDEFRISFSGREIYYLVGHALFDSTCCGFGGCRYALVHGFVRDWKKKKNPEGRFITKVERVRDKKEQKEIEDLIKREITVNQVKFM